MRRLGTIVFLFFLLATFSVVVPEASPAPQPVKEKAPDFELFDMLGNAHKLSSYRGNVVVLNFWATWCPECVIEMPALDDLYRMLKDSGLVVLGVSIDRHMDDLEKMNVSYPLLLDAKGGVFVNKYTVIRLPATFIIDRDGIIAEKIFGRRAFNSAAFVEKMKKLLHGEVHE
jgi:peroxiredoxin